MRLKDGIDIPYEDGVETTIARKGIGPWTNLASSFPGITVSRVYSSLTPRELTALVQRAEKTDPTYHAPNFLLSFYVNGPPSTDFEKLAAALSSWPVVRWAYVDPLGSSPFDPDQPLSANQGYLSPALAGGIDAYHAHTLTSGRGDGQRLMDVERCWYLNPARTALDHEDLAAVPLMLPVPLPMLPATAVLDPNPTVAPFPAQHGTAVLGVICAQDNRVGIIGIAPNVAHVGLASYVRATGPENILDTITNAASVLAFGDVMLLEVQVPQTPPFTPVEARRDYYEAVRFATALGIIVVEAGGNGDQANSPVDLDHFPDPTPGLSELSFNREANPGRDSLAILVSAASSPVDPDRDGVATAADILAALQRLPYAPFGERVDCFAWGDRIETCDGPGVRGADGVLVSGMSPYLRNFNMTSGASAIVAGAALVVQGRAQVRYGFRLGPAQMRAILRNNGTRPNPRPGDTEAQRQIGKMPDLRQILDDVILQTFPNVPLLYMRDTLADQGIPHDETRIWMSPDIILKSEEELDPQGAFGQGSGREGNDALSTHAVLGQTNFVYVRARNRGGRPAADVRVDVYWSPPSTLMTPSIWKPNKIGQATIANIPNSTSTPVNPLGGDLMVSAAIIWPANRLPPEGHNCFVAMLGIGSAPTPPGNFRTMDNFVRFVGRNPDVAWRNFWVDPMPPAMAGTMFMLLAFVAPGTANQDEFMTLRVEPSLPQEATLELVAPIALAPTFHGNVSYVEDPIHGLLVATLSPQHVTTLPKWLFAAGSVQKMALRVDVPPALRSGRFEITVVQLWNGQTVGGFTWQLAPSLPSVVS